MDIDFYIEMGRLKLLPRTGWVNRGIPHPASVAEHMLRSQLIAYDFATQLWESPTMCANMMMFHDLSEARAGDITPYCNVSKEEKAARELNAAKELTKLSGNREFLDVFLEYEEKKTGKAKLCNDADHLEGLLQALEYAELYPEKRASLEDFWPYAHSKLLTEPGRELYYQLFERKRDVSVSRAPVFLHPPVPHL